MIRKRIPIPNSLRTLRIGWLFWLWAFLLVLVGLLLYVLLPVIESAFYWAEGMVVFSLLFLYYFYRKAVKPLQTIGNAMDLLNEQDFSSRLAPVGQREADRIVQLFNRLMDQLKNERLHVREQNHFLDLLISASPMGVILFDFNLRVTGLNAAALRFLGGLAEADVVGHTMAEVPSPLAAKLAQIPRGSIETVRLNDAMIYRCSSLSFIDRGLSHPFLLLESLTSEIVKAEKKTYEKVIRMIAHEVNNSVAGVTSTLDSLSDILEPYDEGGDLRAAMQVCSERCYGMNHFIARLAEVVKIPDPNLQTVSLNRQVEACRLLMEHVCRQHQIRLSADLDAANPQVRLDTVLFEQVLVNIVKNAAESIGTEGEIRIRTTARPLQLEIADNGAGISPEDEDKLFTPFFSTKPTGQGIGLIFIREILTKHDCVFSLKTDSDGWTRFRICFPEPVVEK